MAKVTVSPIASGFASTNALNDNFKAIVDELNGKVLYRVNPQGEPNHLEQDLDANGFSILNVANINGINTNTLSNLTGYVTQAATSASASAVSAVNSANSAAASASEVSNAAAYALQSKDWANKLGSTVDGVEYSSKHYSQLSASSAVDSANSAATASLYSSLGLSVANAYDFGAISDIVVLFPTDFGFIV